MAERTRKRHPHAHNDVAPGAAGPGEPGYDGRATVGDAGAAADPVSYRDEDGGTGEEPPGGDG